MTILLWILAILLLIIIVALFTKVTVSVHYKKESDDHRVTIMIRALFGLFRYKREVPLLKEKSDEPGLEMKRNSSQPGSSSESAEKTSLHEEDALSSVKDIKNIIEHVFNLKGIVLRFLKKIRIKQFEWNTVIGTGDAASTGVVSGAAWAIKGNIIGIISNFFTLHVHPKLAITPDFQRAIANTNLKCMIQVRVGHAILAGIQIFKYWRGKIPKFKSESLEKVNDLKN